MKHKRKGFTLIEVVLFLAVTSLLLAGMFGMTQNSIKAQRFNDSVQSFAEFLRRAYSAVANPQSVGDGRSETAIYGKLITFGESKNLSGISITGEQEFFMYDVVGDVSGMMGTGDVKEVLKALNANVIVVVKDQNNNTEIKQAGIVESFKPTWSSSIDKDGSSGNGKPFKGSLLIVRHPRSGTITTLFNPNVIQVNSVIRTYASNSQEVTYLLSNQLGDFETRQVDFCVNPAGYGLKSDTRRDVRIVADARNASGVEVIELDAEGSNGNKCK